MSLDKQLRDAIMKDGKPRAKQVELSNTWAFVLLCVACVLLGTAVGKLLGLY